ncbi:hypothetical protein ACFXHA_26600 [Nocardia sp. NPDC059240]|uniref:hypothetical protein n=1 Tax=Nocardia sp. NPDC059240 TaxID=3346786 RepID=UPI0036BE7088
MTTGAVADARHVIGTRLYGDLAARSRVEDRVIECYYVLLWAYERLATGADVLTRARYVEALEVLRKAVEWHSVEIAKNIRILNADKELRIQDEQAIARFEECFKTLEATGIGSG